ncbi:nucleolar protein 12 [Acrasis kona]|uniref:Nucleolar protein 12 n=1 Tax=Acrasis kona TaxID=1008807 RepID=A0AAW2YLB4_9EUKA
MAAEYEAGDVSKHLFGKAKDESEMESLFGSKAQPEPTTEKKEKTGKNSRKLKKPRLEEKVENENSDENEEETEETEDEENKENDDSDDSDNDEDGEGLIKKTDDEIHLDTDLMVDSDDEKEEETKKTKKGQRKVKRAYAHGNTTTKNSERSLFVGNFSIKDKSAKDIVKQLKNIFAAFGQVEAVRLRSIAVKDSKLPTRKSAVINSELIDTDKKSTCNGYVVFKNKESVDQAAEELNGKLFEGRHLTVDHAIPRKLQNKDHKNCVFLGNLPFDVDEEEVWSLFETKHKAKVQSVRLVRDNKTLQGKGFGYVFLKEEAKPLVELAKSKPKSFSIRSRTLRLSVSMKHASSITKSKKTEDRNKLGFKGRAKGPAAKKYQKPTTDGETAKPWQGIKADKDTYIAPEEKKKAKRVSVKKSISNKANQNKKDHGKTTQNKNVQNKKRKRSQTDLKE